MKEEVQRIIADLGALESRAKGDEIRLLREAKTRLLLVWEDHRNDPPRSLRGRAAGIDEALNRGDGSYRP